MRLALFCVEPSWRWRQLWLPLLCCLLLCLISPRSGAAPQLVDAQARRLPWADAIEICEDRSASLSIDAVASGQCPFTHPGAPGMSKGMSASAWWLRITVMHQGSEPLVRWLSIGHPRLQSARLYLRAAPSAPWTAADSGTLVPRALRPLPVSIPVFPLTLPADQAVTLYVRVNSASVVDITPTLWQPMAFMQALYETQMLLCLALGGMGLAGVLSMALFASFRDLSFLYYGLAMLFEVGCELGYNGLLQQYLWPAQLAFPLPLRGWLVGGAIASFGLFFNHALNGFPRLPALGRLRSVYRICLAATLLGTLYSAVIDYRLGVQIWTLALDATLLVVVLTLALAWRHGSTTASRLLLTIVAIIGVEGIRLAILLGAHADNVFTVEAGPWAMVLTAPMILISISQRARAMQAQVLLAQQANAAKSDFLARVSHDLRSPLNTIIGYAGMLRRGSGRLSLREGVDGIEASGKRLLGLIDELLDQSRLSAGKLTLHPGPVVLATWLDELRRGNELRAQHSGNRFSLQQDSPLPAVVIMDGDRLWQVLDNLLTNASRHTHQGQITLRVRADAPDDGQVRLHIEVSDTGCGIALAEQQAVFEPFVQGSQPAQGPERRRPGVGLGLPIAKDLVHLMGGELQLQSEPGQGSTFRFSVLCGQSALPAPPKAPDHPAAHPAAPTAPALPLHQLAALADSPRVLVVEDNPMARRALTDLLAHAGFQPLEAASGQEAEAMLDEADAIVTDQHMAGGDGWHVLRTARAHHASMPIILLSAVAPQRPPDLAPSTCFDLVLKKPAGEQELIDHLLMLIERERRTALCRPPAAALHALRELIAQGAVTDIETWCDELEATQAECQAYARLVRHAVLALDFTRLQALATDSPPSAA